MTTEQIKEIVYRHAPDEWVHPNELIRILSEILAKPRPNPEWLGDLAVIELRPADRLIVKVAEAWGGDLDHITQTLYSIFPGHNCVVLAPGIDLGVAREAEDAAANNGV
jgi:hypothetical protein